MSMLCIVPGIREFALGWVLFDCIKVLVRVPFISIHLTDKRIKKLNKEMQKIIVEGKEPPQNLVELATKLENRKKLLTK